MNKFSGWIFPVLLLLASTLQAQQNRGELSNLVCFVRFAGEDASVFSKTAEEYSFLFNAEGQTDVSVYNYFRQASYNQLAWKSLFYPASSISDVISYQASRSRNYYLHYSSINTEGYDPDNAADALLREQNLVKEITDYLNSIVPQDAVIDTNHDGVVDNLCIIISGYSELSAKYMMWPHRSTLYIKQGSIAGKTVNEYIMLFDGANGWNSINPIPLNAGVLCHEMSHTLGTRDLYHSQKGLNPVGIWDLMSDNQLTPQGMSAYTKYKYCKWTDEIPGISTPGTYTLHPVGGNSKENTAFKIQLPESREYFILEYRKQTPPFESGLPGSGLLIYRINPDFSGNEAYDGTSKFDEQYLFRPGGTTTADGNIAEAFFSQESGRTAFGGSAAQKPFYHDGAEAGFAIADIGTCGETISFQLLPFTPRVIATRHTLQLSGEAGSTTGFQVQAVNTGWEISEKPEWLNLSPRSGSAGTSDITVSTISRNDVYETRKGNVIFRSTEEPEIADTLQVTQLSAVIQAPYGLKGTQEDNSVLLSWEKPLEGSAVLTEDFEDAGNQSLWTMESAHQVGWVWQESAKYKLPYEGNYSARLNTEMEDRHQDERFISPAFANGGRLIFYSNSIAVHKNNTHNFYCVEVSDDNGASWHSVFDLKTQGTVVNQYERLEADLSGYLSDNMRVAFHAYDDNNIGLSYWWQIDNISVYPYTGNSMVKTYDIYRNGEKIGTSTSLTFTDEYPLSGTNVYAVKATGDFGETALSETYSIEMNLSGIPSNQNSEQIRPEISKDQIRISGDRILSKVALYDLRGRLLYRQTGESTDCTIPISGLHSGFYILSIQEHNKQTFNYKIIL